MCWPVSDTKPAAERVHPPDPLMRLVNPVIRRQLREMVERSGLSIVQVERHL
jgi:hypothetical protein